MDQRFLKGKTTGTARGAELSNETIIVSPGFLLFGGRRFLFFVGVFFAIAFQLFALCGDQALSRSQFARKAALAASSVAA